MKEAEEKAKAKKPLDVDENDQFTDEEFAKEIEELEKTKLRSSYKMQSFFKNVLEKISNRKYIKGYFVAVDYFNTFTRESDISDEEIGSELMNNVSKRLDGLADIEFAKNLVIENMKSDKRSAIQKGIKLCSHTKSKQSAKQKDKKGFNNES